MNEQVHGNAQAGDLVAYADMANQRTVYLVREALPERSLAGATDYRLYRLADDTIIYSDLRQPGWTFALDAETRDGLRHLAAAGRMFNARQPIRCTCAWPTPEHIANHRA